MLKSAENVMNILFAFQESSSEELGLNELSRLTGINKGTVHKIIPTLMSRELLIQNESTKKYRLGFGLIKLANRVSRQLDLFEIAHSLIRELSARTGRTVTLGVRNRDQFVFIDRTNGNESVRFHCEVGKTLPFYKGAAAKACFAHAEPETIHDLLSDHPHLPKTKLKALSTEFKKIRSCGYSLSNEEVDLGVLAIGVPIFNMHGDVIGGMAIAGIKEGFTDQELNTLPELLLLYSKKLSNNSTTIAELSTAD